MSAWLTSGGASVAGVTGQCRETASQQAGLSPMRRFTAAPRQHGRHHAVKIDVSDPVVALAVHQRTHEVFAGTLHGAIALLDRRQSAS